MPFLPPRRALLLSLLVALLTACAPAPVHNPIAQWVPSPNFDERRPVLVVLHFTDDDSAERALHTLRTRNSGGPVSSHYLIGKNGHIYQLVDDHQRAWHAGVGRWGTITDVNSASIGIELDNDGDSPFTQVQIDSLLRLLADLTDRWRIPRTQVIGHEDMAPGRKTDPGPHFPWQQLAQAGFGLWPQGPLLDPPADFDPWAALALIGYPLDNRTAAVQSFHHHYRGLEGDTLDDQDRRILYTLSRQLGAGGS
ncbi:N-acetylmuramoyl-L-alanine amidase [Dyella solisilvae]|uniref:N-acetylmuramoyl-L-alanine amidase n=1 Tax=Dyella solisilvae TaxID=1920168 RepID=A0A370KCW3_9GAMM|nr:N-acetylmuramoyl-L-alanine amidase [Dyella solisilvae]RDI99950.1 N-acetylmuramoyl-L-alanine amidase [Dyella solisilvae]